MYLYIISLKTPDSVICYMHVYNTNDNTKCSSERLTINTLKINC